MDNFIGKWNSLPDSEVGAPCLEDFKEKDILFQICYFFLIKSDKSTKISLKQVRLA